ncbi:MAG: DUF6778 family protein [Cypionkella sp.]|uniref:DUF6778 family protein n=1 Tax=Cypionkella sp. TaxID=2811411 RepID=UPI002ABB9927|nr:DUF6778 family protein [Cypionkella sp.]MDZ4312893.1 DUF6778 family protein [Cypionkella sp.]MDZ4392826.1 DUF6778 family protein [Cypionkella sp.]
MKMTSLSILVLALGLSACGQTSTMSSQNQVSTDLSQASRLPQVPAGQGPVMLQSEYDVKTVNVIVPRTLKVSEANTFRPSADIVWRGDLPGDRYAQVKAIFETAAARSTASMHIGQPVVVDLEVVRFHCLTEKTRYTIGGVHSMHFLMTVRDAATGAIIQGPRMIVADVKGAGGARAIAEEEAGRTQKVVVTDRLTEVLRRELSAPVAVMPADAVVTRFDGSPALLASANPVQ